MKKLCVLSILVVLASSCSKKEMTESVAASTTASIISTDTSVNDTPRTPPTTNEYFNQFVYQDLGSSKFKYLTGSSVISENGAKGIAVFVSLFLLSNNNYELRYKEANCDFSKGKNLAEVCIDQIYSYTFKGAWSVINGSLELDNFAGAGELNNAGAPAAMLMFHSSINSEGLKAKPIVLTFNEHSSGI